jgi:hypothetical protein
MQVDHEPVNLACGIAAGPRRSSITYWNSVINHAGDGYFAMHQTRYCIAAKRV